MSTTTRSEFTKSAQQLRVMRSAGQITARAMDAMEAALVPGITTSELDQIAHSEIKKLGAKPAFLGQYGFPATICISLNEEIVHGIPSDRVVNEGDLVSIDCGSIVDGLYSDMARTFIAGTATDQKRELVECTRTALDKGIAQMRLGNRVGHISHAVETYVKIECGLEVVREYVGHGIGRALHEQPQVPNFGSVDQGPELMEGMVLAVEPMVNAGTWRTRMLDDGWTVVTEDGALSAHYEDTIAIIEGVPEVFTRLES